jgi:hypothetical protein
VSILPTFYEQLLHQNPFAKKLQTQIVSIEKLRKKLSYEKAARKLDTRWQHCSQIGFATFI